MFGKTEPVCKSTLETVKDYLQFIIMSVVIAASPTAGSKEPAVTYVSELLWSFSELGQSRHHLADALSCEGKGTGRSGTALSPSS